MQPIVPAPLSELLTDIAQVIDPLAAAPGTFDHDRAMVATMQILDRGWYLAGHAATWNKAGTSGKRIATKCGRAQFQHLTAIMLKLERFAKLSHCKR
ncbi:MAG: hypothetical protein IE934_07395 [Sphingopyxis sp.]|nr:hypothetical protein [Sphingopyxis sp.]